VSFWCIVEHPGPPEVHELNVALPSACMVTGAVYVASSRSSYIIMLCFSISDYLPCKIDISTSNFATCSKLLMDCVTSPLMWCKTLISHIIPQGPSFFINHFLERTTSITLYPQCCMYMEELTWIYCLCPFISYTLKMFLTSRPRASRAAGWS